MVIPRWTRARTVLELERNTTVFINGEVEERVDEETQNKVENKSILVVGIVKNRDWTAVYDSLDWLEKHWERKGILIPGIVRINTTRSPVSFHRTPNSLPDYLHRLSINNKNQE